MTRCGVLSSVRDDVDLMHSDSADSDSLAEAIDDFHHLDMNTNAEQPPSQTSSRMRMQVRRSLSMPISLSASMSAEDDPVLTFRATQILIQRYASSSALPPPGKFTRTYGTHVCARLSRSKSADDMGQTCRRRGYAQVSAWHCEATKQALLHSPRTPCVLLFIKFLR